MLVLVPFATPIAVFDMSEFLPFIRRSFVEKAENFKCVTDSNGLFTTLVKYELVDKTKSQLGNDEEAKAFKEAVEAKALQFSATLGCDAANFKAELVSFWLNEMTAGAHQDTHNHYGRNISGCFYADMPKNAPGTRFWAPSTRFDKPTVATVRGNEFNAGQWEFVPTEGQLLLWESWIPHEVLAGSFEGVRRSAPVDVILTHVTQ